MIETFNSAGANPQRYGNGTELVAGDKVWMCTWDKTLLEVELMVNEYSMAALQKNPTEHVVGSNDDDEDNVPNSGGSLTTTITVNDISSPLTAKSSASSSSPSDRPPRPPGAPSPKPHHGRPPPPPPASAGFEEFEFIERLVKRGGNGSKYHQYSRKVIIKEYRPNKNRLRSVLGIDRTDVDPEGRATLGAVHCRKMIVQTDSGLREYNSDAEVVQVTMREVDTESKLKRRGDEDTDDDDGSNGCKCRWES